MTTRGRWPAALGAVEYAAMSVVPRPAPVRCAGCGAELHLGARDPLPDDWRVASVRLGVATYQCCECAA